MAVLRCPFLGTFGVTFLFNCQGQIRPNRDQIELNRAQIEFNRTQIRLNKAQIRSNRDQIRLNRDQIRTFSKIGLAEGSYMRTFSGIIEPV